MPRRRLRKPVVSRLTLAWTGLAVVSVGIAGYAILRGGEEDKIALPVDGQLQRVAPPSIPTIADAALSAPLSLRDSAGSNATPPNQPAVRGQQIDVAQAPNAQNVEENATGLKNDPYNDIPTLISPSINDVWPDAQDAVAGAIALEEEDGGEIVITINGGGAQPDAASLTLAQPANLPAAFDPGPPIKGPQKDLLRETVHGRVPHRSAKARPAQTYAKPYEATPGVTHVSLIVGGLGFDAELTERAINELPAAVTLGFAPYAKNLEYWATKARAAGHETVLELPMEAHHGSPETLGVAGLLTSRSETENLQRLNWLLSRFEGYFAVTNYLGGKFSSNPAAITPVLAAINQAGLAYIDDTGAVSSAGVPTALIAVDRIITAGPASTDIKRDLKVLERIAARNGAALGKTHADADIIAEIAAWAETAGDRDIALAPASAILHHPKDAL